MNPDSHVVQAVLEQAVHEEAQVSHTLSFKNEPVAQAEQPASVHVLH
jgi:hypothetical protein